LRRFSRALCISRWSFVRIAAVSRPIAAVAALQAPASPAVSKALFARFSSSAFIDPGTLISTSMAKVSKSRLSSSSPDSPRVDGGAAELCFSSLPPSSSRTFVIEVNCSDG